MNKDYIQISKKNLFWGVALLIFLIWVFYPLENSVNDDFYNQKPSTRYSGEDMFSNIEEFHFTHMPIRYYLDVDSYYYNKEEGQYVQGDDDYQRGRIKLALDIIENSTDNLIQFEEITDYDGADLIIFGNPPSEENSDDKFMIEGLAGPIEIDENLILQSQVDLYPAAWGSWAQIKDIVEMRGGLWEITEYEFVPTVSWAIDDCKDFPNTEVHEILHAFGIDHTYNSSYSIMFPIKHLIHACKTKEIDKDILSCLNYIYSDGEIEGNCSNVGLYPWPEEVKENISDFKWERLPITYGVIQCNDLQKWNLQKAEIEIEKYLGYNLYELKEIGLGNINFYCQDSFDNLLLNEELDFWDTGVYFPASQPYYEFDDGKINQVKIILFAQNRRCGGIEIHEFLHGAGLREHYGPWMNRETELCDTNTMVVGTDSLNKIKELYELD